MRLNRFMIRPLVENGLREELSAGDTTGGFLADGNDPVLNGQIYAKGNGIVCGLLLADETIKLVEPEAEIEHQLEDGDPMKPGTVIFKIRAHASTFFAIERAALDWIQQLSGISTKVHRYMDLVKAHRRPRDRYTQGLARSAHGAEIRRAGRRRAQPYLQSQQLRPR